MSQFAKTSKRLISILALVLAVLSSMVLAIPVAVPTTTPAMSYIVQASSTATAAAVVAQAGGTITRHLTIINAVVATLDVATLARLRANPNLALHADRSVATSDVVQETDTGGYLLYPAAAVNVHSLHEQTVATQKTECKDQRVIVSNNVEQRPLRGWGVTVAIIDSGLVKMKQPSDWSYRDATTNTLIAENSGRCIVYRDFLPRNNRNDNSGSDVRNSTDQNGHGTHVLSTIADNRTTPLAQGMNATPVGVAPQVNLMVARVLDKDGAGSYGDVIAAIEWIVNNRVRYNVRVLNLSLYAPVSGPYWADPLNQAVMRAWQAGIVVVAAAGNMGPGPGTITVPGNVPYVITVGAVRSGRYTADGSDELANYSSRGPTESAFVKPDVLVPGTRTIAPVPKNSSLSRDIPEARIREKADVDYQIGQPATNAVYYQLSGTSMAAAQVSGIVALMLQVNPQLSNDQIKYRLLATARPAINESTGELAYSIWEQGAGLVNAYTAIFTDTLGAANVGMDIALDLNVEGDEQIHYWGNTTWDPVSGEFRLINPETGNLLAVWDGASRLWSGASRLWSGSTNMWAGNISFWAGNSPSWAGSTPSMSLSTTSTGEMVMDDHEPEEPASGDAFTIAIPLVLQ